MTRNRILIAVVALLIPILVRGLWFYQGWYWNNNVKTPDYASLTVPEPPTPSRIVKSEPGVGDGKVVLIDNTHLNQFDPSEIEPLTTDLVSRGAKVEIDDGSKSLETELKYSSAYIIFSPGTSFSNGNIRQIQDFVASGGRLLVFTDPTRGQSSFDANGNPVQVSDVNNANPIVGPFGLAFVDDYLYNLDKNEGNFRNVEFTKFVNDPLTADLNMIVFYGAHSVQTDQGQLLAQGDSSTLSSLNDLGGGLSPLALSSDGQVLAVGDFTFMTEPFNQVADNNVLVSNIADFALGGTRIPSLHNFPYLFQHSVSLVPVGDVQLTADMLSPIATLQQALAAVNITVSVRSQSSSDSDTIVLGTFTPSDDLSPYLRPFNIQLDSQKDYIDVPNFGKVGNSGNGLLLLNTTSSGNTLTLLADTTDDLPSLIDLVSSGDLSSCVIQGNIGVCSIGTSSSFSEGTATPSERTGTPTERGSSAGGTPTEVATPTPTPSG